MKIEQAIWSETRGWDGDKPFGSLGQSAQLVLIFASAKPELVSDCIKTIRAAYPVAQICGCSTTGEIHGTEVLDQSLVMTAVAFEHTRVQAILTEISDRSMSFERGKNAINSLDQQVLKHVFVLSDNLKVQGSELLRGMNSVLPDGTTLSGGFASDNFRYIDSHVWCNDQVSVSATVSIGFYGEHIKVALTSNHGWDAFGPQRMITKCDGCSVYEIDGAPALKLYKEYLGEDAAGLPGTGVQYPLFVKKPGSDEGALRAMLGIDEADQSIQLAVEVTEGSLVRLMHGRIERLIEGVIDGASDCVSQLGGSTVELAILVSCAGRRPLLKQRIEEETEAIADIFGPKVAMAGYYSYGEIAPTMGASEAAIHNQTMTVTCFSEL